MKPQADTAVMIACGLALLVTMTVATAQGLADPTKPPAGMDKPATAPAEAGGEQAAAAAGLQTIIRRHGAKPAAVINGEYVVLGGRVGDARLVKIGEDSVTLKSATGMEILRLAPGIEKSPVAGSGKQGADGKAASEVRRK